MALTRKSLKGMNLTEEQVESIMEMHLEVKEELLEQLKAAKEKVTDYEAIKAERDNLKKNGGDGFKEKYEKEHNDFEAYKKNVNAEKTFNKKQSIFLELAKGAKISDKRLNAIAKLEKDYIEKLELDDNGKAKDATAVTKYLTDNYGDFIVSTGKEGVDTPTPPANGGGNTMTKEQIRKIEDPIARQKAMLENAELFGLKKE